MLSTVLTLVLLAPTGLYALGVEGFANSSLQAPPSLVASCANVWDASKIYLGGNAASFDGESYTANYWNLGRNPANNSGAQGTGQPWTANGLCGSGNAGSNSSTTNPNVSNSTCYPAWDTSKVYVGGDQASVDGIDYTAAWWNMGRDPAQNSGPGEVWVNNGACNSSDSGTTNPNTGSGNGTTGPNAGPAPGFIFSPYKDVTINANWNTGVISTAVTGTVLPVTEAVPNIRVITWAFATGECGSENWGGISASMLATANVRSWEQAGKDFILSTGGAAGTFTCGSDAGFSSFIERYWSNNLLGVDFDIEGGQSQAVVDALVARVKTAQANPRYARLRFSFTIATFGGKNALNLGTMGVMVMNSIKSAGLQNYFVNLMTMDYGPPTDSDCTVSNGVCDMGASAIVASESLHSYYTLPYSQIELTPMIGGNDATDETFTLNNAVTVSNYVKEKGLGGLHFWSFDRDRDCAPGYAQPTCNSYGQAGTLGFSNTFLASL